MKKPNYLTFLALNFYECVYLCKLLWFARDCISLRWWGGGDVTAEVFNRTNTHSHHRRDSRNTSARSSDPWNLWNSMRSEYYLRITLTLKYQPSWTNIITTGKIPHHDLLTWLREPRGEDPLNPHTGKSVLSHSLLAVGTLNLAEQREDVIMATAWSAAYQNAAQHTNKSFQRA